MGHLHVVQSSIVTLISFVCLFCNTDTWTIHNQCSTDILTDTSPIDYRHLADGLYSPTLDRYPTETWHWHVGGHVDWPSADIHVLTDFFLADYLLIHVCRPTSHWQYLWYNWSQHASGWDYYNQDFTVWILMNKWRK